MNADKISGRQDKWINDCREGKYVFEGKERKKSFDDLEGCCDFRNGNNEPNEAIRDVNGAMWCNGVPCNPMEGSFSAASPTPAPTSVNDVIRRQASQEWFYNVRNSSDLTNTLLRVADLGNQSQGLADSPVMVRSLEDKRVK